MKLIALNGNTRKNVNKGITALILGLFVMFAVAACASDKEPAEEAPVSQGIIVEEADKTEENITGSGTEEKKSEVAKFDLKTKTVLLNSGYKMPVMGLGTYSLDYATVGFEEGNCCDPGIK